MEPARELTVKALTARIAAASKTITDCLESEGLPQPSFDVNGPSSFPVPATFPDVHAARFALLEATDLLNKLILGPSDSAHWIASSHHITSNMRTLYRFGVFATVPLDSSISFSSLAQKIGLDQGRTARLLRFAITYGYFAEPTPDNVSHNGFSATLARDDMTLAMIGHDLEDVYPSAAAYTDFLKAHPVNHEEKNETGFNRAFDTDENFFEWLVHEPEREARFALAMKGLSKPGGLFDAKDVIGTFPWGDLGKATIVDIGGGHGHVSAHVAKAFPDLRFVIQDFASVVKAGKAALSADLASRFEFMPHSFFDPQPVKSTPSGGPVVYFLRMIIHDWSDKNCIRILRSLVPALKDGSIILVNDNVLPPAGKANRFVERLGRTMDMQMMTVINSQERTAEDFDNLFSEADPRLKLVKIHTTPGAPLSILEIRFTDEAK